MYRLTIATTSTEKLTEVLCRDKTELARVINGAIFASKSSITFDVLYEEDRNERKTKRGL